MPLLRRNQLLQLVIRLNNSINPWIRNANIHRLNKRPTGSRISTVFWLSIFNYLSIWNLVKSHTIADQKFVHPYSNLTKVIRTNREVVEERTWDEFPVVHDYFFESEEGYQEEGRRDYSNDFQPLCQNVRRRIELRSEVYEYYPPHYVETVCRKFTPSGVGELSRNTHNQMCAQPGFRCVQRTQTLYLTRKRYDSDCWENTKEVIASGCDCMWPGRL